MMKTLLFSLFFACDDIYRSEIVKLLLAAGADVQDSDPNLGLTALCMLLHQDFTSIMKQLWN